MDHLAIIKLEKAIESAAFSEAKLEETRAALAEIKTTAFQGVCRAMAQSWGAAVLPLARTLLADTKALNRKKALELFAHQPDLALIPELEQAKAGDRAKKLHREYDYAIRRIRQAYAREHPAADPRDLKADPRARLQVLAAMPYQELWELLDVKERYWGHIGLPIEGDAADAKRRARLRLLHRCGQTQPLWLVHLLFHVHPLAGEAATQLVWDAEGDRGWVSFRWLAGHPVDAEGHEVALPVDTKVRLAHPIEIQPAALDAWLEVARSEGWAMHPLRVPIFQEAEHPLGAVVSSSPALDERRAKAWLANNAFEASWVNEHARPHATDHVALDDRCRVWLRLHHDAVVARRTGQNPIRLTRIELPLPTPRRHSEAVRLVRALGEHAGVE